MTFRNIKLADLSEVITKGTTPTTMGYDFQSKGINFYKAQDLLSRYPSDTDTKISIECHDALKRSKIRKNDILVSIAGTIGRVSIWNSRSEANCNQAIAIIRCKPDVNALFSYYALTSGDVQDQIKRMTKTTAQPNLNLQELGSILIPQPSSIEQKSIVSILSSLDDKIELNNKINNNLEELAQTLYKHWFVDFEFPNEEGLPYKSSGGKMVESELGNIPKGWEVYSLLEVINFISGSQPPKSEHLYNYKDGYVRFIQNRDYSENNNHITYIKKSNKNKYCNEYDIMMDKYGEAGKVRYGLNGAYNVALAKIECDVKYREFLRRYFEQKRIENYIYNASMASTRPSVNSSVFKNLKVVLPEDRVLKKFSKISLDIIEKILFNKKENQKLANLRDLLLPKLMSGEIRVPIEED